jgi:hypothetical protein
VGWDAPVENEDGTPLTDLAGYRVYHGTASGVYSEVSPLVTETRYTVPNLLTEQAYYFAVTALDTSGNESDFSDELERLAKAITPVIDSGPGGLPGSLLVSIGSGTVGASIHVTLDGSTPTAASPVYTDPILLLTTTTIKAIAAKDGMRDSNVAEETLSIGVVQNQPPVLTALPNRSDAEGVAVTLQPAAFDPDGDSLSFAATGLPEGLAIIPGTGAIAGTLPHSASGTYSVAITVTDGTDSDSKSFIWTVTNVNMAPTAALTEPAAGATFQAGASITVRASASDPDGTIARVEFHRNGQLLGQDPSSPYTYAWGNLAEGTYTLTATAIDNDGASTTSAGRAITVTAVQNQPPVAEILSPSDDDTCKAGEVILFSADASAGEGASVSKVEFYANGAKLAQDTRSPYVFTWGNAQSGTYVLQVKATDNVGNTAESPTRILTVLGPVEVEVFEQDGGMDGLVAIEAENYQTYASGERSSWSIIEVPNASGAFAVQSAQGGGAGAPDTGFEATQARLDYFVNFNRTGIHSVWLRGEANGNQDGTVFVGINGHGAAPDARVRGLLKPLQWTDATVGGPAAVIDVPSVDVHVVQLWVRDRNVTVDKIVISAAESFVPEGQGPMETAQVETGFASATVGLSEPTPPRLALSASPDGDGTIILTFARNTMDTDAEYTLETSTDMATWIPYPGSLSAITAEISASTAVERCSLALQPPVALPDAGAILRLRVIAP